MLTRDNIRRYIDRLLAKLYVDDCNCINCNAEMPKGTKYGLCNSCLETLPFNNGKVCLRCGRPVENEAYYCLECQNHAKMFEIARSPMQYKDDISRLILNYKFYHKKYLGKYFAEAMTDCYINHGYKADILIPVPLSKERLTERGYNQSALLAKAIGDKINVEVVSSAVVKVLNNRRQSELSSKARRENVVGAYKVIDKEIIKGKNVVIIDDVLTTGSTVSEVARKLYIAGAKSVKALTYAVALEKVQSDEYIEIREDNYMQF